MVGEDEPTRRSEYGRWLLAMGNIYGKRCERLDAERRRDHTARQRQYHRYRGAINRVAARRQQEAAMAERVRARERERERAASEHGARARGSPPLAHTSL